MKTAEGPIQVTVQLATALSDLPGEHDFACWVNSALACAGIPLAAGSCVTIRLVDEQESQVLNSTFRNVPKPTNVLAFPAGPVNSAVIDDETELGDLVICAAVVMQEARAQAKPMVAHFAHLTIHGCLHLAGYDHMDDVQAAAMESLEVKVMADLGFPDPYGSATEDSSNA